MPRKCTLLVDWLLVFAVLNSTACRPLPVAHDAALVRSLGGTIHLDETIRGESSSIVSIDLSRGFYAPVLSNENCWSFHGESGSARPTADIGDEEFSRLEDLSTIRRLNLGGTKITGKTLARIAKCRQLTELDLSGTSIGDEDLLPLRELHNLRQLHLAGTNVTDNGVAHLSHLPSIQVISLDNTTVSDSGLLILAGIKQLKRANLRDTNISVDGVGEIQQARPDLRIEIDRYKSGFVI